MGRTPVFLAALWWGGLSAISFVVVPLLFSQLGNPSLAGTIAAKLFSIQSILVLAFATALLAWPHVRRETPMLAMLVLAIFAALTQELLIAPHILQARALGESVHLWHSLGTVLIFLQWLLGGTVLFRLLRLHSIPAPVGSL